MKVWEDALTRPAVTLVNVPFPCLPVEAFRRKTKPASNTFLRLEIASGAAAYPEAKGIFAR